MARRAATPAPVIRAFAPDLQGRYPVNVVRYWFRRQAYVKGSWATLGPLEWAVFRLTPAPG